jgi:hypothetical protein
MPSTHYASQSIMSGGHAWLHFYLYFNVVPLLAESCYIYTLVNIDVLYPGLRELLETVGISVQGQSNYRLRTAIDQRGEQTINKDAKTTGMYTI